MELQFGIVLAVIIGAVLLVDRLGGTDEMARRLFQVALGIALAYFVVSGTTFVVEPKAFGEVNREANRELVSISLEFILGVLCVLFGIGGLRRWRTVPLGIAVGGIILLLSSGTASNASVTTDPRIFNPLRISQAARGFQLTNFALSGLGFAALTWFGFSQWDREPESGDEEGDEEEDIGSPG